MAEPAGTTINPTIAVLQSSLFKLPLPGGWVDRSIYCAGGPVVEGFQPTLIVTMEHRPDDRDVRSYVDEQLHNLAGQLDGFQLLGRGDQLLGRRATEWAEYDWTSAEGVRLRQIQWYMRTGRTVFVLTGTASQAAYAELKPVFDRTAQEFAPIEA